MNDWPLLMAVTTVIVLLAGTLAGSSLAELQGYKNAVAAMTVCRFRATTDCQHTET